MSNLKPNTFGGISGLARHCHFAVGSQVVKQVVEEIRRRLLFGENELIHVWTIERAISTCVASEYDYAG